MGDKRYFQVESKSFEIVKHAYEVNLIDRGRNHVSNVSMRFAAASWFHDALLEVARLTNNQNVFRSFREGNKVFVVQKQRNDRGRFVTVTVLGDSKGRGCVIILEGRDAGGWRGVSHEINGLLLPKVNEKQSSNHRWPIAGAFTVQGLHVSNSRKESRIFKDAVIQGDDIPKISHIDSGININMHQFSNCLVNGSVDISLKIILGFGHNNKWEVKWAGLLDKPNGQLVPPQTQSTVEAQPDNQPNNQKNQPNNKLLVSTDAVDLVAAVQAQ